MSGGSWIMGGQQLIVNGGFETSLNSWAATTSLYQSTDPYVGSYSGRVGYSGLGTKTFYQRGFSVVAGREYFVRFANRHGSPAISSFEIAVMNYGASSYWSDPQIITPTSNWTLHGFGFTAGDTGSAALHASFAGAIIAPGSYFSAYFDEVTIYEAAEIGGGYGYKFVKHVPRQDNITRTGALHSYILSGGYREFEEPASHISSAARCATNSFWKVGSPCFFVERAEDPTSTYLVNITGNDEPFQTLVTPYGRTQFAGTLAMETHSAN